MYKIVDVFTTKDGSWFPDEEPYSVTHEMARKYSNNFPEKGGATHLFAKIEGGPSNRVRFFTRDNQHQVVKEIGPSGWANIPIEHGSAYNPDRGETGWWNMQVEDAPSEVAEGFGLPFSWHVSNFVVFRWEENDQVETPEETPQIPEQPSGEWAEVEIRIRENGRTIIYTGKIQKVG